MDSRFSTNQEEKLSKYNYYKLHVDGHPGGRGRYVVKGYGIYEKYSVLAGQTKIVFLGSFDTEDAAREAYPLLPTDGTEYSSKFMDRGLNYIPKNPPAWFDETICGERWDEDY